MAPASFSHALFERFPVAGILRGFDRETVERLARTSMEAGLTCLEVTLNSPGATGSIRSLREICGDSMNVGAGTVCTLEEAEEAYRAGAQFLVSPVTVPEVVLFCKEKGLASFPGAFTPTEIHRAWELGADLVKLFPANALGPGYIRDLKAPLPQVRILATGGVTVETLPEYRRAGADGFGVGSPLFSREKISAGDWDWLRDRIEAFRTAFESST